jgi:His/Glu/Gln/Arg/opine family amino acid ABC transporter permease subunit
LLLSVPLALALALALGAAVRWRRWPAKIYALVIRGTPMLAQIYMVFYGLGSLIPRE